MNLKSVIRHKGYVYFSHFKWLNFLLNILILDTSPQFKQILETALWPMLDPDAGFWCINMNVHTLLSWKGCILTFQCRFVSVICLLVAFTFTLNVNFLTYLDLVLLSVFVLFPLLQLSDFNYCLCLCLTSVCIYNMYNIYNPWSDCLFSVPSSCPDN